MKRLLVLMLQLMLGFTLLLTWPSTNQASAASIVMTVEQQNQAVQGMEETLFGVQHAPEPLNQRVIRLEEMVFGQSQGNEPLPERIAKLQSILAASSLKPLSAKARQAQPESTTATEKTVAPLAKGKTASPKTQPYKPTVAMPPEATTRQAASAPNTSGPAKPIPGETDYPTISQMELKRFGQAYSNEDITKRLSRLENDVFKIPQTGSLADRVDNLKLVVLGDTNTATAAGAYGLPPTQQSYYTPYYPAGAPTGAHSAPMGNMPPQYTQQLPGSVPYSPMANGAPGYPQAPYYPAPAYPGGATQPPINSAYGDPMAMPASPMGNPYTGAPNGNPNAYADPNMMPPTGGYHPAAYNGGMNGEPTPDMLAAMTEIEKSVLGNTYTSEPVTSRLDRLEDKVFRSTSPDLSPDERMQRVIAVASAGGAPQSGKAKAKSTLQSLLPIILTILPLLLL